MIRGLLKFNNIGLVQIRVQGIHTARKMSQVPVEPQAKPTQDEDLDDFRHDKREQAANDEQRHDDEYRRVNRCYPDLLLDFLPFLLLGYYRYDVKYLKILQIPKYSNFSKDCHSR